MDLLLIFVENPGSLLEKEELMERVWGNLFVEEANLARNVSSLRKALGENPRAPEYIVTVTGHGYRFVADVEAISRPAAQTSWEQTSPTFLREPGRLTEIEKAYDYHVQELIYLKVTPEFDNLRSDPRFSDLTRRIGMTE